MFVASVLFSHARARRVLKGGSLRWWYAPYYIRINHRALARCGRAHIFVAVVLLDPERTAPPVAHGECVCAVKFMEY